MDVDDINSDKFSEDEAIEDQRYGDEDFEEKKNDSEESGEDLMENMEKDYRAVKELDNYEEKGLDDEDQEELDARDRQAVERLLNARDREEYKDHKGGRLPAAMRDDSDENSEFEN